MEFYSNQEMRAAIAVVTRLVYRFRMRKRRRELEQERLRQEEAAKQAEAISGLEATTLIDECEEFEVDVGISSHDVRSNSGASHISNGDSTMPKDEIDSSRGDFLLEGQMSEKPVKARPPPEGASFKQKARKASSKSQKQKIRANGSSSPTKEKASMRSQSDNFSC